MITTADHTCFGDSITQGTGDPAVNGYRRELLAFVKASKPSFTMNYIGPNNNGDTPTNRFAGTVGATVADMNAIIATTFGVGNPYNPTTMSVLIGTNNAASQAAADAFPTDYPVMMANLHAALPTCGFVVSLLPPAKARQTLIDVLNGELPGLWDTMAAAGYIIERATPRLYGPADYDPTEAPTAYVHPSPVGYVKLAQAFLAPYLRLIARL
jgi:lysophospholipase L1-like esterase